MHSRGSVFPLLRRIKVSVRFLESLLFLLCSHQVLIDSQHVPQVPNVFLNMFTSMMPITKGKRRQNLGAPHNKLICHTIKSHRTSLNSRDLFKFVMKTRSFTKGDGLVVQTLFDITKVPGSHRLVGE
jgi:hypothetical protein